MRSILVLQRNNTGRRACCGPAPRKRRNRAKHTASCTRPLHISGPYRTTCHQSPVPGWCICSSGRRCTCSSCTDSRACSGYPAYTGRSGTARSRCSCSVGCRAASRCRNRHTSPASTRWTRHKRRRERRNSDLNSTGGQMCTRRRCTTHSPVGTRCTFHLQTHSSIHHCSAPL